MSSGFKMYTVLFDFFMGCLNNFFCVPGLYGETVAVLFLNKSLRNKITSLTSVLLKSIPLIIQYFQSGKWI